MDGYTLANVQHELNNPNSAFYLGNPSTYEQINNLIHGGMQSQEIRTNYFGKDKNKYLSPPTTDSVEILNKVKKERKTLNWVIGGSIAAVIGFLFRGKIPIIGKLLKKL